MNRNYNRTQQVFKALSSYLYGESKILRRCTICTQLSPTGGKQYKVEAGEAIFVEKLNVEAGEKVTLTKLSSLIGDSAKIGTPTVAGATVTQVLLKSKAKKRKLLLSSTKPRNIHILSKVIVNHILRLLLTPSTLNRGKYND